MTDDAELLRRYAEERSEPAFAEFVQRHLGLVYAAALRRTNGDEHGAAEVAQQVFTTVARRAAILARHDALTGWLYTAMRNAAHNLRRDEQRRRMRECEAGVMSELLSNPTPEADWNQLHPVLDEAMDELNGADREAVLLRFFEGRAFAELGAKLHLTENAARMRVERALDKLRAQLARRGITSTSAALGVVLANQAGAAAPVGLAASVTGAAMGGAGSVAFVGTTKIVAGVAIVIVVSAIGFGVFKIGLVGQREATPVSLTREGEQQRVQFQNLEARAQSAEDTLRAADPRIAGIDNTIAKLNQAQNKPAATTTKNAVAGVNVMGAVQRPGYISFPDEQGLTLIDAIVRAGGLNRLADKKQVSLKRTDAGGNSEILTIDVDAVMKGKTDESWPLRPGDVIFIPQLAVQRP